MEKYWAYEQEIFTQFMMGQLQASGIFDIHYECLVYLMVFTNGNPPQVVFNHSYKVQNISHCGSGWIIYGQISVHAEGSSEVHIQ